LLPTFVEQNGCYTTAEQLRKEVEGEEVTAIGESANVDPSDVFS
jgi:hypothetical protein